ncbi:Fe-S cluster assembly protein SufD [Brucellaceae bacterium C25G]
MNIQTAKPKTPAESALIDMFGERIGVLSGTPDVFAARDNALEELKTNGLPSRRIESWHYTDLRTLFKNTAPFINSSDAKVRPVLVAGSSQLAVVNGVALPAKQVSDVTTALVRDLLQDGSAAAHMATKGFDDAVGQINAAYVSDGWALTLADDTELEAPLELQNVQQGGQSHVRFPAKFGKNTKATIIERQIGGTADTLSSSVSHVTVDDGADIIWVIVREFDEQSTQLSQFNATLGANAKLTLYVVNAGGNLVRQEIHVDVIGEDSDFEMRTLNLLTGKSHTDVTMTVGHLVENTRSVEIVRNVVTGEARGVFQGMIKVAQIAQKTDARMACNTLLLSDGAEFDAKPELEIFADDVACGHGATVTEIHNDHLFYLMARGVPEQVARGLLIKAFIAEIIEELEDESLVEALETILSDWLAKHA